MKLCACSYQRQKPAAAWYFVIFSLSFLRSARAKTTKIKKRKYNSAEGYNTNCASSAGLLAARAALQSVEDDRCRARPASAHGRAGGLAPRSRGLRDAPKRSAGFLAKT